MHYSSTTVHGEGIAFVLGEDLALYGVPLPEDASPAMRRGHAEESASRRSRTADRFVRKWLQLRVGAWRRNRAFDNDVTPEYLRSIDAPVCPVSGVTLTHGLGLDTDWSVDRFDNDAAYARQNLVVLATRVNQAKGNLRVSEMVSLAGTGLPQRGLSAEEWARLAYFAGHTLEGRFLAVRPVGSDIESLLTNWALVALRQLLAVTKKPARARKQLAFGWLLHFAPELPVEGCALLDAVAQFASRTSSSERTVQGFAQCPERWAVFSDFWAKFREGANFTAWLEGVLGWHHLQADLGVQARPVKVSALKQQMSKASLGYC